MIWTPVRGFDLGVEVNYLRAEWNNAATPVGFDAISSNNWTGKVRVQRNF